MKGRILFLLKYTLFWVILFAFARFIFEAYNFHQTAQLPIGETIMTFIHGFRLDISITGYFISAIGLMVSITAVANPKYLKYPIDYLTYLLIFVTIILTVVDIELYRNWGFRMDTTALHYLETPKEALASSAVWLVILLLTFWLGLSILACLIYKKYISVLILEFSEAQWFHLPALILVTALYFIPIRGTFTVAPINAGTVYFSNNQFANHAAVNVTWNFLDALLRMKTRTQSVNLMDINSAKKVYDELNTTSDSTVSLLNTPNPNVLILVLESFTSDGIESFGGVKGVTPNMDKFANEGIAFKNIYATNARSDKGLVAIISGYPGQLGVSIMNFPNKTRNLPSLATRFNQLGYTSAYYYGGDANFANIKSFMLNGDFKKVEDMSTIPGNYERNSKWGIHDHLMLEYLSQEIDKEQNKFFKILFTLSSHEPFEVPMEKAIEGDDENSKFLNSMHYTDRSIGKFIETAKTKAWWQNTLVILIADHSVRFPFNREIHLPRRYAIPMIWLGGALKTKGLVVSNVGGQQDLAATLLNQMGANSDNFPFSKNLLDAKTPHFATYSWANGVGIKTDKGSTAYSTETNKVFWQEGDTTNLERQSRALYQIYINDFNNKELQKTTNQLQPHKL